MSIVLPRPNKRVDIYTASNALQRAKERFGPKYFDSTLLECPLNAIELKKLLDKWNDLDKKKVIRVNEISREQERLVKNLKSHLHLIHDIDLTAGTETAEGKMIPPGFRYHSNGELKASTTELPHLKFDEDDDQTTSRKEAQLSARDSSTDVKNKISKTSQMSAAENCPQVDYDKEIRELENVLYDIYKGLLKSRIELLNTSGGSIRSFLRSHKNEYVPTPDTHGYDYESPNDRFAFKPGSSKSEHLHKKRVSCPTHRNCIGCQFKLKLKSATSRKADERGKDEVGKRRWNYVPHGKYVGSTVALSTVSLSGKPSSSSRTSVTSTHPVYNAASGHNVHFQEHDLNKRTKCEKLLKVTNIREDSSQLKYDLRTTSSPALLSLGWRSRSAMTERDMNLRNQRNGRTENALSGKKSAMEGRFSVSPTWTGSSPGFSSHLRDHRSRMNTMKCLQVSIYW